MLAPLFVGAGLLEMCISTVPLFIPDVVIEYGTEEYEIG